MEAIAEVVAETGALKGKRRRVVDSTVLDDAVARQGTITQLIAAVRRFGRDVPWDDQGAKDALISALVTDALALLTAADPDMLEGKAADGSRCWPSSPDRTWNRQRIRTGQTGDGGSPGRSPRTR
jgi:hypothetical protein